MHHTRVNCLQKEGGFVRENEGMWELAAQFSCKTKCAVKVCIDFKN